MYRDLRHNTGNFGLDEIRAYFGGDRITCLRCGKSYRRLSVNHLHQIHSLTEDDYRAMYGLPWRRGLVSEASRAAYEAAARKRIADGTLVPPGNVLSAYDARHAPRRPDQPFRAELGRRHLQMINGPHRIYDANTFERILQEVASGRGVDEVLSDPGMPGRSWLNDFRKENPEADRELSEAISRLPYTILAQCEMLDNSATFWSEVVELRRAGLSDKKIAAQLGVSTMTVNRGRHRNRLA